MENNQQLFELVLQGSRGIGSLVIRSNGTNESRQFVSAIAKDFPECLSSIGEDYQGNFCLVFPNGQIFSVPIPDGVKDGEIDHFFQQELKPHSILDNQEMAIELSLRSGGVYV